MDTTPPGLETVSTTTSSRKRPLDRGDKAGALAGASGPDTGIPPAESPGDGALVGSAVSGASAGASRPDTEPPKEAPPSSVKTSGSLADCGKLSTPAPSSTLRTSLATSTPMNQRLQDQVTYSFADDGNILLTNVMAGLPCLPRKLDKPLRSLQVGEIVDLCLQFDVTKLTPANFARIVEVYSIAKAKKLAEEIWEAKHLRKGSRSMGNLVKLPEAEDKVPFMCGHCFTSWLVPTASKCLHCGTVGQMVPTALPSASVTVDGVTWTMTFDADQQLRWQSDAVDHGDQQKSAYSIEVSSLGQNALRLRRRHQLRFHSASWLVIRADSLFDRRSSTGVTMMCSKSPKWSANPNEHKTMIRARRQSPSIHPMWRQCAWCQSFAKQNGVRKVSTVLMPRWGSFTNFKQGPSQLTLPRPQGPQCWDTWMWRNSGTSSRESGRTTKDNPRMPSFLHKPLWNRPSSRTRPTIRSRSVSLSSSVPPPRASVCGPPKSVRPWRVACWNQRGAPWHWRGNISRRWRRPTFGLASSSTRARTPSTHGCWKRCRTAFSTWSSWSTKRNPPQVLHALIWGVLSGGFHFHGPNHEGDRQWAGAWFRRGEVGHDPCDVGLPQRRGQGLWRPVDHCSWSPYAARLGF